ncbi:MAG TPA: biotin carboxylase, partial [Polyangiaceae bacterium]|nr:biotin carboxylase [Polyangiaceae bacterium]
VEHGITELVFGVDLVELQLLATAGDPITAKPPASGRGHAVEVRLYAEDPERGFIPQPGRLERFEFPPEGPDFRVDTGLRPGDTVTPHYDPLLAKVMARGDSRPEAIARLLSGLRQSQVVLVGKTGAKRSNLELMQRLLDCPEFVSGDYTTHLVDDLLGRPR